MRLIICLLWLLNQIRKLHILVTIDSDEYKPQSPPLTVQKPCLMDRNLECAFQLQLRTLPDACLFAYERSGANSIRL
jgi:hypothetical protein